MRHNLARFLLIKFPMHHDTFLSVHLPRPIHLGPICANESFGGYILGHIRRI